MAKEASNASRLVALRCPRDGDNGMIRTGDEPSHRLGEMCRGVSRLLSVEYCESGDGVKV